jgi:hypothetical protein
LSNTLFVQVSTYDTAPKQLVRFSRGIFNCFHG